MEFFNFNWISYIGSLTLISLIALIFYKFKLRSNLKLHQKPFENDVVYLFQFPTSCNVPCISPFAIKIETWLRLKKINYKVISTIEKWSTKGQIPFVEINGQQIADSNFIIKYLKLYFKADDNLTLYDKGISRAIEAMLDNQTVWSYFYYRYVEKAKDFINSWKFITVFKRKIVAFFFPSGYKKRSRFHGIGRHSSKEIYEIGMQDLLALSHILGNKPFLLGNIMSTVDCYLFGHLAQILYIPSVNYPHANFIRENCLNLDDFCKRIIDDLWPEWSVYSNA